MSRAGLACNEAEFYKMIYWFVPAVCFWRPRCSSALCWIIFHIAVHCAAVNLLQTNSSCMLSAASHRPQQKHFETRFHLWRCPEKKQPPLTVPRGLSQMFVRRWSGTRGTNMFNVCRCLFSCSDIHLHREKSRSCNSLCAGRNQLSISIDQMIRLIRR